MRTFEQYPEQGQEVIKPYHYPGYIKASAFLSLIFVIQSIFFGSRYIKAVISYNLANKQYSSGHYVEAKENYIRALEYAPNSDDAKIGMALTCFSNKDTTDDEEGLNYLYNVDLSQKDWNRINEVIPEKFRKYMGNQGGNYR